MKKWLIRSLLVFLLLLVLSIATLALLLGTGPGRALTTDLVTGLASSEDMQIEIEGLDSVFGDLKIKRLAIADKEGLWLEAQGFSLRYSLADLLRARLSARHLVLNSLKIERAPIPSATEQAPSPAASSNNGLQIPALWANIDHIAIERIALGEPLLGKAATLSLEGELAITDQPLRVSGRLDILHSDGGNGGIKAAWDFVPDHNRRQLSLILNEPRGGLAARLLTMTDLPAINLSLKGDGPADDWQSQLAIALDDTPTVAGRLIVRLTDQAQRLDAQLSGQLAPFTPPALVPLVAGSSQLALTVTQEDGAITLPRLSFASALTRLEAKGMLDQNEQDLDLTASFALGQEEAEIQIQQSDGGPLTLGHLTLDAKAKGPLDKVALSLEAALAHLAQGATDIGPVRLFLSSPAFDINTSKGALSTLATIDSLALGSEPLDKLLAGPTRLKVDATLDGSTIALDEADLQAGLLSASLDGHATQEELEFDGRFALTALDTIDPSLAGALLGELAIGGTIAEPKLALAMRGDALSVANKPVTDLDLELWADTTPNASLTLTGAYGGAPLDVRADMATKPDGTMAIDDIIVRAPGTKVAGALTLSPSGLATGQLQGDMADLAALGPLLLQPSLKGAIKADVILAAESDRQSLALAASSSGISLDGLSLSGLDMDARITDPAGTMSVKADLALKDLRAGGERISSLSATMSGENGTLPFSARANVAGTPTTLSGTLFQQAGATKVHLAQLKGGWQSISIALTKPVEIDLTSGAQFLSPLSLNIDGGLLSMAGKAGDALDLDLTIDKLPLSIANKLAPTGENIAGRLDLDATIKGTSANPLVNWQGTISNLAANSLRQAGAPALAITSKGGLKDNLLSTQNVRQRRWHQA